MHELIAANVLAAYPDHNKWFDSYTDASDYQLGACIVQDRGPVANFSCKLSKSQQNYTVMEKKKCFLLQLPLKNFEACSLV
jgi:hypothetical protein